MHWKYIGLVLLAAFWLAVRPPDIRHFGQIEDLGGIELPRQIMAENLARYGRPVFSTHGFMAPYGASIPFTTWSAEREGLGALAWMANREIPFLYLYFGASLLAIYIFTGKLARRMGADPGLAWGMALLLVLFNTPRNFRMWYHFEHMTPHWIYLNFLFDAYLWSRAFNRGKWSAADEAWRTVILLGIFLTAGYYWGPVLWVWLIVHASLIVLAILRRNSSIPLRAEWNRRRLFLPVLAGTVLFCFECLWFYGLYEEIGGIGNLQQQVGWFVPFSGVFAPLWLPPLYALMQGQFSSAALNLFPSDASKFIASAGWVYWILLAFGLWAGWKRRRVNILWLTAPFLLSLLLMLNYLHEPWLPGYHAALRYFPFMSFFRVASRMGLFLVPLIGAVLLIVINDLQLQFYRGMRSGRVFQCAMAVFAVCTVLEFSMLAHPVLAMPRIDRSLEKLLKAVKALPGDAVLDLPFCVAGGNGVCTREQCPHYPLSTAAHSFRTFHDKAIYGMYVSRARPDDCKTYDKLPYTHWFDAWRKNRCLQDAEWEEFCRYLEQEPGLAGVMLYPEIWEAAGSAHCMAQFKQRLGPVLHEAQLRLTAPGYADPAKYTRIILFGSKCVSGSGPAAP